MCIGVEVTFVTCLHLTYGKVASAGPWRDLRQRDVMYAMRVITETMPGDHRMFQYAQTTAAVHHSGITRRNALHCGARATQRPSSRRQERLIAWNQEPRRLQCLAQPPEQRPQPNRQQRPEPNHHDRRRWDAPAATAATALLLALACTPAAWALELRAEPANALSLPTWMVHVSSGGSHLGDRCFAIVEGRLCSSRLT